MSVVHVLHFWSPTCGPCMTIKPSIELLKEEFEGQIDFISINIKEDPKGYSRRFEVTHVPTMIVFKGDVEIGRYSGTQLAIVYTLIRKAIAA